MVPLVVPDIPAVASIVPTVEGAPMQHHSLQVKDQVVILLLLVDIAPEIQPVERVVDFRRDLALLCESLQLDDEHFPHLVYAVRLVRRPDCTALLAIPLLIFTDDLRVLQLVKAVKQGDLFVHLIQPQYFGIGLILEIPNSRTI